jgi:Na+/phosphate symporter
LIGTALAAKVILDRMKNQLPFLLFWAVTLDAVLLQERLNDLGKVRIGA